jgi:hypothetical protein
MDKQLRIKFLLIALGVLFMMWVLSTCSNHHHEVAVVQQAQVAQVIAQAQPQAIQSEPAPIIVQHYAVPAPDRPVVIIRKPIIVQRITTTHVPTYGYNRAYARTYTVIRH